MDSGTNLFINNSITPNEQKVNSDTITNNYAQNIENNTESLYNNSNEESGINERNNGQIIGRNDEKTRIYEEQKQQQNREYTWEEYNKWEESIKPIKTNELTSKEQESINKSKTEHNKDIYIFDENNNDNTYSGF